MQNRLYQQILYRQTADKESYVVPLFDQHNIFLDSSVRENGKSPDRRRRLPCPG